MVKLVGSYSIRNLLQSTEFLLDTIRTLNDSIQELEKNRDEVRKQQKEATKQGLLVKKMTSFMSEELSRIEQNNSSKNQDSSSTSKIPTNIEKFTETENKLRVLRERLTNFIEGDNSDSLSSADNSLSIELKQYESFLLGLTTTLNEKIASLEKISNRIIAEKRESEQQKILLRDMIELFSEEIEDLEQTLKELKK
jgi:DNA repair exonuclease SbcCD ATPase subunit